MLGTAARRKRHQAASGSGSSDMFGAGTFAAAPTTSRRAKLPVPAAAADPALAPAVDPSVRPCGHAAVSDSRCSIGAVTEDLIPKSVLAEMPSVIRGIADSGDDIYAFLAAMDRVESFARLSRTSTQHPGVIVQLEKFRTKYDCVDCHPVEYLHVRLAVARMMNGCGHYADAKGLLRRLLEAARRVLVSGQLPEAVRRSVEVVTVLLEACFECAELEVIYLI